MSLKVLIPVPKSQIIDLKTGEMALEWYLFFSRTIGGSTLSDAELLAVLGSNVDATAVAAQNAADEARLLAYALDNAPKDESRNIEDAKLAGETHPNLAADIAELRKEVQNLRVLIETI